MFRSLAVALVSLGFLTVCTSAAAHVKTAEGNWLFTGSTYNDDQDRDDPPNADHRADPVTVIWRGPSGTSATVRRALDHTEEHWTDRRIPGVYPKGARMKPRSSALCTSPQFVFHRKGNAANVGGWGQSRGYMTTNGTCLNQYHTRLFTDFLHGQYFPGAEHQNEWVLAPIHHERFKTEWSCCPGVPTGGGHEIDLPWDGARRVYIHALKPHCTEVDWDVHPESSAQYGKYVNSGVISRISFAHDSDGCG